ncbi:Nuclear receptor ROR-alpha [Collichthys lucidus]|uniref:Nuclear receptor ROR-alpha n=1 Tax=Collichthys lucidus TaxID=240159 RepID=A0A4V6ANM7_COLLU|nr:Nuclear receptor ROR-alpha [Collichthys lucidus]
MESPPDPASDPGNSASEPATPVRETPVNLETLRKADHPAPVRRQTCSSTNREQANRAQTKFKEIVVSLLILVKQELV